MINATWPRHLHAHTQRWLNAAALTMAAVVGFGPLELRAATLHIAGLTVSSVEVLAAVAIGSGLAAIWQLRQQNELQRRLTHPLYIALAAWAGLHLSSALWSDAALFSLKFGLRVTGGVALASICLSLGHLQRFRRTVAVGLLGGLAAITLLGICERAIGREFEPILQLFRNEPTWMLGEQRLSTVFFHANTLAAYLELSLPFLLVVPWLPGVTKPQRGALLLWTLLTGAMLSLTYSRAGLLAGVLSSVTLFWAARRQGGHRRLAKAVGVFAGLLCIAFLANPDMRARLGFGKREYRVRYDFSAPCRGLPSADISVPLTVTNLGEWPISDRHAPGEIGYLIWPRVGPPMTQYFGYRKLPALGQGDTFHTELAVHLPDIPGNWALVADIRRKGVMWLSAVGTPVGRTICVVEQPANATQQAAPIAVGSQQPIQLQKRPLELARRHYWEAALRLLTAKPWLGHGADRFRMTYRSWVPAAAWDGRARAHSVLFETAADLGIIGLALLGVLLGLIAAAALPNLQMLPGSSRIATAATIALVGFGLHSLVDYFLAYTQIFLVVWPIVGLATAARAQEPDA